jgi:hypothetical protein
LNAKGPCALTARRTSARDLLDELIRPSAVQI